MSKTDFDNIKLFAMDVDGTLTDGHIYMGNNGELLKAFHVHDGLGIKLLRDKNIIPAIITGRQSEIVKNRCLEMGITEYHQDVHDKKAKLYELMKKYDLSSDQVAFMGDDMNDLGAIELAGISFAPADCAMSLRPYVDIILTRSSGNAPVREAIDLILSAMYDFNGFTDL